MVLRVLLLFNFLFLSCSQIPWSGSGGRSPSGEKSKTSNCLQIGNRLIEQSVSYVERSRRLSLFEYTQRSKALHRKFAKLRDTIKGFKSDEFSSFYGEAKIVMGAQEGLAAKVMAIREAKYSVDLSYYIFKNDESGKVILEELRRAVKRGVRVRMFVDAFGSYRQLPFYTELRALQSVKGGFIRAPNGEMTNERAQLDILIFNPIHIARKVKTLFKKISNLFRSPENKYLISGGSPNRRAHDKILLVDAGSPKDALAIVGGRNISNKYYQLGEIPEGIRDMEMVFKPNSNHPTKDFRNQLEHYYNRMFFHSSMLKLRRYFLKISPRNMKKTLRGLRRNYLGSESVGKLNEKVKSMQRQNYFQKGFDEGEIKFMHELGNINRRRAFSAPFGKDNIFNRQSIIKNIGDSIKKADKSIDIVSPYVWLKKEEIEFIHNWLKQDSDRRVRIVSNSILSTDNILAQAMIDSILGPKLVSPLEGTRIRDQIQLFSYGLNIQDPKFLHAKYVVIDDEEAFVTTSNFDPRSRYLNTEIGFSFKPLKPAESKTVKTLTNYTNELAEDSVAWGSEAWKNARNNPENRTPRVLNNFAGQIIKLFRLEPLL